MSKLEQAAGGNRYSGPSELSLRIRRGEERPVLERGFFTAPFKVTSPFYTEEGRIRIMVLNVSAGIMAGDSQKIDISVGSGAEAEIQSQSFEKIHRMNEGASASRNTNLWVESDALLVYSPLPTIPFAGSAFESVTRIHLNGPAARLVYRDILSCGRAASGERFAYRWYKNRLSIFQEERLVYFDNNDFRPAEEPAEDFSLFETYSHLSNLLLVNIPLSEEQQEAIAVEAARFPGGIGGTSLTGAGALCVRCLGNSAEAAMNLHEQIKAIAFR
jgi:urease accessory protein